MTLYYTGMFSSGLSGPHCSYLYIAQQLTSTSLARSIMYSLSDATVKLHPLSRV